MKRPSHPCMGLIVATVLIFSVGVVGLSSLAWPMAYAETFPGVNGKIAFAGQPVRYSSNHIYTINEDGSGLTDLTPTSVRNGSPSFSADGKKIVFTGIDDNYEPQIYVMNADGSGMTKITNDELGNYAPTFSPDGKKICFTHQNTRDDNAWEIYVMNADGSDRINLTNNAFRDGCGSWSPDGTKIVFNSNRDANQDNVYVMNADGSGVKQLTDSSTGHDGGGNWSPDGKRILFNRFENGVTTIYVMNADGTGQTELSKSDVVSEYGPVFSPDGKKIVFTRSMQAEESLWIRNIDGTGETQLKIMYGLTSPSFGPQPQQVTLSVRSQDTNGKAISGLWTVLYDANGNVLKTGFTPATFTLNIGQQYRIGMANFGSSSFDHWLDNNSSANPRSISIKDNTQLTAVYKTTRTFPITHMSDTTASAGYAVHSAKPARAELVTSTSQLIGDKIDSITLKLKRVGTISGSAAIGILDSNNNVKKAFGGALNVATLTTTYTDYEVHLTGGELYTIQSGDRIGIRYTGGTTTTWVAVMLDLDAADPFDGTKSYAQYYQGSWLSNTDRDMYMILKQTHG